VDVQMIRVDKGEHKQQPYLQINPLGKVRRTAIVIIAIIKPKQQQQPSACTAGHTAKHCNAASLPEKQPPGQDGGCICWQQQ
jgi:hypothetical protein